MANPGVPNPGAVPPYAQPPQPPLPPRPPRSMAGAIVLILIGVLFLMGTMGVLNWHGLVVLFGRYWPALLILWGIIKLLEHEQYKRAGLPSRGIGVGGVFLMLFVIMGGLIATGVSRVDWGNIRDHLQIDDNDFDNIFGGQSFDYSGDLNRDVPAGMTGLRINDDRGTVTVNVSDEKQIRVSWRKKVHAENQTSADDINKKTDISMSPADKIVTLNPKATPGCSRLAMVPTHSPFWDREGRELLGLQAAGFMFESPRFSADGRLLGCRNRENQLYIWCAPSWPRSKSAERN